MRGRWPRVRSALRATALLTTCAVAAEVATASLLHHNPDSSHVLLYTSGAVRFARSAWAAAQVAREYRALFRRFDEARGGPGFASAEYKRERSGVHARAAERLVALCKGQGGVYLKFGQHAASLTHALPGEYTERLVVLQDDCARDSGDAVRAVWREEFPGRALEHMFEEFEEAPVASASLAQVHRARTIDGQEVAVKIQHPGLAFRVAVDLTTVVTVLRLAKMYFPYFDMAWVVPEMRRNLQEEMDFLREGRNAEEMQKTLAHCDNVAIPKVYWAHSSRRVLTMEWIDGIRISDTDCLQRAGIDPTAVARTIADLFADMTFVSGFMHCDPHAGNLLVRLRNESGSDPVARAHSSTESARRSRASFEVVLLDHGLCRQISPNVREAYCELWRALILRDTDGVQRAAHRLGVPDSVHFWSLFLMNRSWSAMRLQQNSELTKQPSREEMKSAARELKRKGISRADVLDFVENVPRDLLLVFKVNSLARNIIQELQRGEGVRAVDRFVAAARLAVRGLHYGSLRTAEEWEREVAEGVPVDHDGSSMGASQRWIALWDRFYLELRLAVMNVVIHVVGLRGIMESRKSD